MSELIRKQILVVEYESRYEEYFKDKKDCFYKVLKLSSEKIYHLFETINLIVGFSSCSLVFHYQDFLILKKKTDLQTLKRHYPILIFCDNPGTIFTEIHHFSDFTPDNFIFREEHNETIQSLLIKAEISHQLFLTRSEIQTEVPSQKIPDSGKLTQINFLSNMSHELRTPLNGIIGLAHLMLNTSLTHEQKEFIDLILGSSDSLLKIINDILDYSRIDADKLEIRQDRFSLNEKIVPMLKTLTVKAHQKGLEMIYDQNPDVPEFLIGDYGKINQVLINLIGNAIKFTEMGEIRIEVRKINQYEDRVILKFLVSDTGKGIDSAMLDKVFDPFFQIEDPIERAKIKGSGLGLTISRQLVELMGGELCAESEREQGSCFSFTVLLETQPIENIIENESALKDIRVLIIDDSAGIRKYLRNILTKVGMITDSAGDRTETLHFLELAKSLNQSYDIILLDLVLQDCSGWDLAELIRQDHYFRESHIVIITGMSNYNLPDYAEQMGIHSFLRKPVSSDELLHSIMKELGIEKKKQKVEETPVSFKPMKILLVEDESINRRFAQKLLENAGNQVVPAINGKEAVDYFIKNEFDLILMDIQMPVMNGYEASRTIRQLELSTHKHTPIIALTAYSLQEELDKCFASGMDDCMIKPVNLPELYKKLEQKLMTEPIIETTRSSEIDMPVQSCMNQDEFRKNQNQDNEFMVEIIDMFLHICPEYMKNIRQSIAQKDPETLQKAAHTLKGSLRTFFALKTQDLAFELEKAGKERNLTNTESLFNELEKEIRLLIEEMNSLKNHLSN